MYCVFHNESNISYIMPHLKESSIDWSWNDFIRVYACNMQNSAQKDESISNFLLIEFGPRFVSRQLSVNSLSVTTENWNNSFDGK